MKVGVSAGKLPSRIGMPLSGYRPIRRSAAEHRPLYVRVTLFESGAGELFIAILIDALAVGKKWSEQMKGRIRRLFPDRWVHVAIASTHSHSSHVNALCGDEVVVRVFPDVFVAAEPDEEWCRAVLESVLKARRSSDNLTAIRLYSRAVSGVGASRRERGTYLWLPLQVAQFICVDHPPIVWANFPCHPTVLGRGHTWISPDLHGSAAQMLQERGYRVGGIWNGPAADISTRFTRRESSVGELERLSGRLADRIGDVLNHRSGEREIRPSNLAASERSHLLLPKPRPDKPPPDSAQSEDILEGIRALSRVTLSPEVLSVSIWKFDSWTIHWVPGELPLSAFLWDRKASTRFPADRWIIGYANDYPGYLMPEEDGSYESVMTLYNPEEIRRLIDELRESI
jgi:hypothetical protein